MACAIGRRAARIADSAANRLKQSSGSVHRRTELSLDTYAELARRVRHDLIKNLDIPSPGVPLSFPEMRVFIHRVFEPNNGMCKAGEMWCFKIRKSPLYVDEFSPIIESIQEKIALLRGFEQKIRMGLSSGSLCVDADVCTALRGIVSEVHAFEAVCEQCASASAPNTANQVAHEAPREVLDAKKVPSEEADMLAALAFMGISQEETSPEPRVPEMKPESGELQKIRVLVVDDQLVSIDRLMARSSLRDKFAWVTTCHSRKTCDACADDACEKRRARTWKDLYSTLNDEKIHGRHVDLLLLDVRFDTLDSTELLWIPDIPDLNDREHVKALQGLIIARAVRHDPDFSRMPIVLMTARKHLPDGANRLLEGLEGLQFVDDDNSLDVLASRMENVVRQGMVPAEDSHFFWGSCQKMQVVRRQAELMSFGPRTVFITGPSGSGKSYIVENVIYPASRRHPLVTLDLSAVPENLVESELFGHVKGAFSGATHDRPGLIEEANGGILFLDEIGNLSPENQKKLLLFLNDKMVRRVGAAFTTRHHVDVKVVAATHLDLAKEVEAGRFRFDLYMRLAPAVAIELPTLSERREDLGNLVSMLVRKLAGSDELHPYIKAHASRCGVSDDVAVEFGETTKRADCIVVRFAQATRELFESYDWPGNTRELESILDALVLKTVYDTRMGQVMSRILEIDHYFALSLLGKISNELPKENEAAGQAAGDGEPHWLPTGPFDGFADMRQALERAYLCHAYEKVDGNMAQLAENLFGDGSSKSQHRVTVRFNQLGLSIRSLKGRN